MNTYKWHKNHTCLCFSAFGSCSLCAKLAWWIIGPGTTFLVIIISNVIFINNFDNILINRQNTFKSAEKAIDKAFRMCDKNMQSINVPPKKYMTWISVYIYIYIYILRLLCCCMKFDFHRNFIFPTKLMEAEYVYLMLCHGQAAIYPKPAFAHSIRTKGWRKGYYAHNQNRNRNGNFYMNIVTRIIASTFCLR